MFHEHYFFSAPVLWLLYTNYSASHSLRGLNSAIFSHSRWHHITVLLECNVDIPELDIDTEGPLLNASVSLSFMETQLHVPHPPPVDVGKNAEKTFWSYNSRDQIPYFDISRVCVSTWGNVPTMHRLSRRERVAEDNQWTMLKREVTALFDTWGVEIVNIDTIWWEAW